MSRLSGNTWSALGIGATGLVVGFMVGGSATPVGSVAVPAVFGLVMAGVALVQPIGTKEIVEALQKAIADPNVLTLQLERLQKAGEERRESVRRNMGIILLIFALLYALGMVLGGLARTRHWLASPVNDNPISWKANPTKPPSVASALEWVLVQQRLLEYGYKPEDVRALYAVQEAEWKQQQDNGATPRLILEPGQQSPATSPNPKPSQGIRQQLEEWDKWQKEHRQKDAPVAWQSSDQWPRLEALQPQSPLSSERRT